MKANTRLTLLALVLVLHGHSLRAGEASQPSSSNHKHSCCSSAEAAPAFTDKSLYQVGSRWTTDAGKEITLGALRGKPQVVAMFFANCQYACPLIVNDMRRIESALAPAQRARVGFTLVTFDPKRDTVQALAQYRQVRDLPSQSWTLLRGGPDDVQELAALLGVRYKQDARGQFAHSNVITVLNADGEIVHQQIGLNQNIEESVKVLAKLVGSRDKLR